MVKNLPSLNSDNDIYFLIKAFAAGVILSTGVCGNVFGYWDIEMMESLAIGYHKRSELNKAQPFNGDEEISHYYGASHNANNHHIHGFSFDLERSKSSELIRQRIISQWFTRPKIIKPLVAALSFHQFFEGVGLGGCIYQAKFKRQTVATMVLFFSLTTPTGIAVGTGISNTYNENSPSSLIIQGLLLAASARVLIYMSLVDLLAADFMNSKMVKQFQATTCCKFRTHLRGMYNVTLGQMGSTLKSIS
ncbi:Zinc/iron permease [Trema orientale]|uniref:Zinc/iron permease n=1 Tax=Trema orientale TaxID=63057 RepID=A0A2P5B303_TREOI|nr:Zinc/iron permease [Trema orientale]